MKGRDRKILLINSLYAGGAEKVVTVLLEILHKQGTDIELVCLERNSYYNLPREIDITFLSNLKGKENSIVKLLYIPIWVWKLNNFIKKNEVVLVQSHLYRANYINILTKLFGSKHTTQIVNHGLVSRYKMQGLLGKINLFLIKCLYEKADLIILISKIMQIDFQKLFNFEKPQIVIINNPFNVEDIEKKSKEIVSEFNFDKNKKYLISVGRLIPLKRNKDLINALKYLKEDVEVILLGEGTEKEKLIYLTNELKLTNRVHFVGLVKNPFKYIRRADVFVLCSENESFGNVLIESMICRTPIISTGCGGAREILAPNSKFNIKLEDEIELAEYGILTPIGNVIKLAEAVNLILDDKIVRNACIDKAYSRANEYSANKIVNQYKKVLALDKNQVVPC